jgi:hypothetical protein
MMEAELDAEKRASGSARKSERRLMNRSKRRRQRVPKVDLVRDLKELYRPPTTRITVVEIPKFRYLMIDGQGDPNTSSDFRAAVEALYAASYTIKFMVKNADNSHDYKVMPLEGLWWADDMSAFSGAFSGAKDEWKWTMMILQPAIVTEEQIDEGLTDAARKKGLPALEKVKIESLTEGLCAQIMYLGPYSAEGPIIEKLHAFIAEQGYTDRGKHHEIYLGDPRRTSPERLRTVIRQPISPAQGAHKSITKEGVR